MVVLGAVALSVATAPTTIEAKCLRRSTRPFCRPEIHALLSENVYGMPRAWWALEALETVAGVGMALVVVVVVEVTAVAANDQEPANGDWGLGGTSGCFGIITVVGELVTAMRASWFLPRGILRLDFVEAPCGGSPREVV